MESQNYKHSILIVSEGHMAKQIFSIDNLHICGPTELCELITVKKSIGLGGAGWVVRVKVSDKDYALKILRPDVASKKEIKDSFLAEARRIRDYKHQNIVEVGQDLLIEYSFEDNKIQCPAFLMEFLQWKDLNDWIASVDGDSASKYRALIKIGESLLDVLDFLHTHKESPLLHLDIKSENVKVTGSVDEPKIKLLDFGVAQLLSDEEAAATGQGEDVKIVGTFRHFPRKWIKDNLKHMTHEDRTICIIPRDWKNPSIDLHLFRETMIEALDNAQIKIEDLSLRDQNAFKYYKVWIDRLSWSPEPDKNLNITSAHEAKDNATRAYGWVTRSSVLFGRGNLRLPIDNLGFFGPYAKKVVDTNEFQRLRGRRQLGFVHYVYPGGVHSRFEHSLGVYGAAIRYLKAIANHSPPEFRTYLNDHDLRMAAAMALVHDLGHYPFAHQIEEGNVLGFPVHETLTYRILFDNDFAKILASSFSLDKKRFQIFCIFCLDKVQAHSHRGIIDIPEDFPKPPTWRVLKGIINGPIDADKFDYLRRDAYHVGVPYSSSLDRERFIDGLTVFFNGKSFELAVKESAISSAEMFALGRYFMYTSVYYNHSVRCFDRLIQEAVHLKVDSKVNKGKKLFEEIKDDSDDNALQKILDDCPCPIMKDHILHRKPYKRLLVISTKLGKYEDEQLLNDYSSLLFVDRRRVESDLVKEINKEFREKKDFKEAFKKGHVLVDLPGSKKQSVNIPIVSKSGIPFKDQSPLWKSVTEHFDMTARKLRVFACRYPVGWGTEQEDWLKKRLVKIVRNRKMSAKR